MRVVAQMRIPRSVAFAVFACLAASAPARAGWVECNEIGENVGGTYKVLVTDLIQQDQGLVAAQRVQLLRDFQERLNTKVAELRADGPGPRFNVILCDSSTPQTEAEFGRARITSLNMQDVITVLWGRRSFKSIRLRYVLVPYRHESLANDGDRGVVSREIAVSDTASFRELWEHLSHDTVAEATSAYFAMGIGVRYLAATDYGNAQRYLCLAKSKFREGARVLGADVPADVLKFLETKLRELAGAIAKERSGAAAFLKQNAAQQCGAD